MKSSVNDELEKLKNVVLDKKNKEIVIKMLKDILNIKLTDFKFNGVKSLKKITEYDFSVLNIVGDLENKKYDFYIKIIKRGEIKKSVFCCWSLIQEEYENILKNTKETKSKLNRVDKVSIKEEKNEEYKNSVNIALEGSTSYNFEVNFIELEKFMEKFETRLLEKFKKLEFNDKDILLIMVKDTII